MVRTLLGGSRLALRLLLLLGLLSGGGSSSSSGILDFLSGLLSSFSDGLSTLLNLLNGGCGSSGGLLLLLGGLLRLGGEENLGGVDGNLLVGGDVESKSRGVLDKVYPADDVAAALLSSALLVRPGSDGVLDARIDNDISDRELLSKKSGAELEVLVERVKSRVGDGSSGGEGEPLLNLGLLKVGVLNLGEDRDLGGEVGGDGVGSRDGAGGGGHLGDGGSGLGLGDGETSKGEEEGQGVVLRGDVEGGHCDAAGCVE
jgi:hypothetical protein